MTTDHGPRAGLRLAEVVGVLSLATDLGSAQPLEHGLRSAVLAVRLGELLALSDEDVHDGVYPRSIIPRWVACELGATFTVMMAR